jgi:hypothetical protein
MPNYDFICNNCNQRFDVFPTLYRGNQYLEIYIRTTTGKKTRFKN